jgi:hypothetical protein
MLFLPISFPCPFFIIAKILYPTRLGHTVRDLS